MSFEISIVRDEITPWLADVSEKLHGDSNWIRAIMPAMEDLQRFVVGISPVVTGSYAGSHRLSVSGREVKLSIDPSSRNIKTGQLVQRYAGAVEERHQVYAQGWEEAERLARRALEDLAEEMGFGN